MLLVTLYLLKLQINRNKPKRVIKALSVCLVKDVVAHLTVEKVGLINRMCRMSRSVKIDACSKVVNARVLNTKTTMDSVKFILQS